MEDKIKNILKQDKEPIINEEINFYLKVLFTPLILDQIFQFLEKDDKVYFSLCSKKAFNICCNKISKIKIEENLKYLSVLNNIPNKYKNIKELIFEKCNNLNYFSFISNIENLEVLHIYESNIENILFLEKNIKIKELKLIGCKKIRNYSPISKLENLLILEISDVNLSDISFLKKTKNIKKLIFIYSLKKKNIKFISDLEKLEYLHIDFGSDVIDISFLGKNKNIKELEIDSYWAKIYDYSFLSTLKQLESISLKYSKISDFSCMNKNIKKLKLID